MISYAMSSTKLSIVVSGMDLPSVLSWLRGAILSQILIAHTLGLSRDVLLKSQVHVVGDIHHQSLSIERGAFFGATSRKQTEELESKIQVASTRESLSRRIDRAETLNAD